MFVIHSDDELNLFENAKGFVEIIVTVMDVKLRVSMTRLTFCL